MMHQAPHSTKIPAPSAPTWSEAQVAVALEGDCYLIDDGRLVRRCPSCVVVPEAGDRVLAAICRNGDGYIAHVLQRAAADSAEVSVPGARQLTISQPQIALRANEDITLHALRDVELVAATGVLSLQARNLFTTVHESLVQNVRHFVGKAEQYLLDVKQLLKLHGRQALVTADQDVKVDGERISMG